MAGTVYHREEIHVSHVAKCLGEERKNIWTNNIQLLQKDVENDYVCSRMQIQAN